MTALGSAARVLEGAPHHLRVGDAVAVVGEDAHAEVVQLAERRELHARAALGDAPGDVHLARDPPASFEHSLHHGRVVERRIGVRHAHDRRATAERRGASTTFHRLGVLAARFPEVHLQVDEPRRDDASLRVEHGCPGARCEAAADLADHAVDDAHVGPFVLRSRRRSGRR